MSPSVPSLTKQPIDHRLATVSELDAEPVTQPSIRRRREATVSELEASETSVVYRPETRREQNVSELSAPDVFWPEDGHEGAVSQLNPFQDLSQKHAVEQPLEPAIVELDVPSTLAVAHIPDDPYHPEIPELEGSLKPVTQSKRFRNHERTTSLSDPLPIPRRVFNLRHNQVLAPFDQAILSRNSRPCKLKKRQRFSSSASHIAHSGSSQSIENDKPQEEKIVLYAP